MPTKYFLRNTNTDATCDAGAAVADHDLNKTQGSGPNTVDSGNFTNETFETKYTFDLDVSGDSPSTGSHTVSIELANMTSQCQVQFRIEEISSGCSVLNNSSWSSTYTTNGIKSESLSLTWSTGDRLRVVVQARRTPTEHGNQSFSISTEDADSFDDAPWSAGTDYVVVPTTQVEQLVETLITLVTRIRQVDETEQLVEGLITLVDRIRQVDEVEQISEGLIAIKTSIAQVDETEQLVESLIPLVTYLRQVDETEQLAEGLITLVDYIRQVDETEQISESVIAIKTSGSPPPVPWRSRTLRDAPQTPPHGGMYTRSVNLAPTPTPTTVSATLEVITGMEGEVYIGRRSRIFAVMSITADAPSSCVVGIAVQINGVNGTEMQFNLPSAEAYCGACFAMSGFLEKGTYDVKAMWRRVSGAATVSCQAGECIAYGVLT